MVLAPIGPWYPDHLLLLFLFSPTQQEGEDIRCPPLLAEGPALPDAGPKAKGQGGGALCHHLPPSSGQLGKAAPLLQAPGGDGNRPVAKLVPLVLFK